MAPFAPLLAAASLAISWLPLLLSLQLRLQPRGVHGEHSDSAEGVYDLSNKARMGATEVQLVQTMIDGVRTLIERERELEEDDRSGVLQGK